MDTPLQAVGMGFSTLVGYVAKSFPMRQGNCFSVYTSEGQEKKRKVVNLSREDFEHLMDIGVLEYPVEIKAVGDRHAEVVDKRVPADYYLLKWCSICTPEHLIPDDKREPDAPGTRYTTVSVNNADGTKTQFNIKTTPVRAPGFVYAPYVSIYTKP